MQIEEKWYTVAETAGIARVCTQTVRNWIRGIFCDKGRTRAYQNMEPLKATKLGRRYLVYGPDLQRFFDAARF